MTAAEFTTLSSFPAFSRPFPGLFPADLEKKRRQLQCPECSGPAFFRHTSPIGRAPCFGARPHATGCSLAAYDLERLQSMANENAQLNPCETIVVDLHYGTPGQSENVACTERSPVSGDFGYGACRPDLRIHRRPSSLLRQLVECKRSACGVIAGWPALRYRSAGDFRRSAASTTVA